MDSLKKRWAIICEQITSQRDALFFGASLIDAAHAWSWDPMSSQLKSLAEEITSRIQSRDLGIEILYFIATEKGPAEDEIRAVCRELETMLCEKNRKYKNSALEPRRVFSKAPAHEQILVRMDDKWNRIENADPEDSEDAWKDLLGYMILLRVLQKRNANNT